MPVFLEEITFNHNPNSATSDAFNIRKNETEFVKVPEWRRGETTTPEQSPAAYAIEQIGKNDITIKAKFRCVDSSVRSGQIQAKNVIAETCETEERAISPVLPPRPPRNDVLGHIPPQPITFSENGNLLTLENSKIAQAGVGTHMIHWQWQFRRDDNDGWHDLEDTTHQIYTILDLPHCPWLQKPYESKNTQLPWTDVLDYACHWARRTQSEDDAAAAVTYAIRDLEKVFFITYDPSAFYSDEDYFDCTGFLTLTKDGIGIGSRLNCSDCASAVSTFSNALGSKLWQSTLDASPKYDLFPTNPIRLFGRTCWRETAFGYHEVAWKDHRSVNDGLFDACLELDADTNPTKPPQKPMLARNLPFGGTSRRGNYASRLVSPNFSLIVQPQPQTGKRRPIRMTSTTPPVPLSEKFGTRLESTYQLSNWLTLVAAKSVAPQAIRNSLTGITVVLKWEIMGHPILAERTDGTLTIQLLLNKRVSQRIRLDIDVCSSPDAALSYLAHRLGTFVTALQQHSDPGELAFIEPEVGSILFLRSNVVVLVRDAGTARVNLSDFAARFDALLIELSDAHEV